MYVYMVAPQCCEVTQSSCSPPPDMPEMLSKHFNGGGKQYLHGDAVKMNSRPTVKSGGVSITHAN